MTPPLPQILLVIKDVITSKMRPGGRGLRSGGAIDQSGCETRFRLSVQRTGRRLVGELADGGGDPAPGVAAAVIAVRRELVDAGAALLERFCRRSASPSNWLLTSYRALGCHAQKNCRLAVEKRTNGFAGIIALKHEIFKRGRPNRNNQR